LQVLRKRFKGMGSQHRVLGSPVPPEAVAPMRLDAVVLDLAVLGPHCWSYLEALCGQLPSVGIVVCTGRSSVGQRVRGLRLGVDDGITKPCHPEKLIARVQPVMQRRRRAEAAGPRAGQLAGELEIPSDQFQAVVRGVSLDLTRREFELIEMLAGARGAVLERTEIYQRVWGYAMVRGARSVDVCGASAAGRMDLNAQDTACLPGAVPAGGAGVGPSGPLDPGCRGEPGGVAADAA
jgi:DNA-binding response OmpR family regulator